jgi:uncharacterized membrane protein
MFSANESSTDRVIRGVVGIVLLAAGWLVGPGVLQIVLFVLGAVALFTAATGFCLLYRLFGIATNRKAGHTTKPAH